MRVPKRKSEEKIKHDSGPFLITQEGLDRLKQELADLEAKVPALIAEVEHTKSHGDFSENAAYQDAKHNLRRTYGRMASITGRIKRAFIIEKSENMDSIQIGCKVDLELKGKQVTFEILGSHESNPGQGRISNVSPLGKALMGHKVGDQVQVSLKDSVIIYTIIKIY